MPACSQARSERVSRPLKRQWERVVMGQGPGARGQGPGAMDSAMVGLTLLYTVVSHVPCPTERSVWSSVGQAL